MKKFEAFLEEVKTQNPDEFQELHDILSRYNTLKESNERLLENQETIIEEQDKISREMANNTKEMNTMKMTLNNKIATKQQDLEKIEDKKSRLMAESEENTSKKMQKTTEHGQILMTIDNLFNKCLARKELLVSSKDQQAKEGTKTFDDMQKSGENAL